MGQKRGGVGRERGEEGESGGVGEGKEGNRVGGGEGEGRKVNILNGGMLWDGMFSVLTLRLVLYPMKTLSDSDF